MLTSTTDIGTIAATLHYNRLPYFRMRAALGKQFDGDTRDFLQTHGIIGEALASYAQPLDGRQRDTTCPGALPESVMKLSLARRLDGRAAQRLLDDHDGRARPQQRRTQLDEWDRYLLQRRASPRPDWAVVTQAKATEHNGYAMLTAEDVRATGYADAAQVAILAFTMDEAQFAVVNRHRNPLLIVTGGGMPAGTVRGRICTPSRSSRASITRCSPGTGAACCC